MPKWRMISTIGPWHKVGPKRRRFRFYLREDQTTGEVWYFADYGCEDFVTRHHKLLPHELGERTAPDGNRVAFRLANRTALIAEREDLVRLKPENGWCGVNGEEAGWLLPYWLKQRCEHEARQWRIAYYLSRKEELRARTITEQLVAEANREWLLVGLPELMTRLLDQHDSYVRENGKYR